MRSGRYAGAATLAVALGVAAGAAATPGPPAAVTPSGFTALDPCPSPAPCPPTVTVGWAPASFGTGLLHRRYVLEPLAGDAGLLTAREVGATAIALGVPAPVDGARFRFRLFGRETELQRPIPELEHPLEIPVRPRPFVPFSLTGVGPLVPIFPRPEIPVFPGPVLPTFPSGPDGPAITAEFMVDATAPTPAIAQSATHVGRGDAVGFDAGATADPGAAGPGSGVAPGSFGWSFGDGATAAGPAVSHRYASAGTFTGELAVADRVGNVARRAFGVTVSAVGTDGVAAATVPDGTATTTRVSARARVSGAAALRALGVDLDRPLVTAAWRASRLRGAIVLSGRASNARALAIRLRAPGLTARPAGTLRTGDGRFRRRVPLPVGVLPGTLALELGDGPRALARIRVRIPAPPEGVARSAVAAVARAGAAVTSAPAATRILFARFSLASLPAGGRPLTITWYQPSGQVAGHPVLKPRRRALVSFVRSRAALPAGRWRAVLSAGDVRVAQVSVRLGSA